MNTPDTARSTQNGKKNFVSFFGVNPTDFLYIVCLFVYFVLLVNGYYTIQSYRLGELYMRAIMPLSYAMQSKVYLDFLTRGVAMIGAGGSPYSITERRVPELVPVIDCQPAGDVSHKPGGRLPLLSTRPAVTLATLNRGLLPISLIGEQRHDGCEQFA